MEKRTLVYSSLAKQLEIYKVQGIDGAFACIRTQHFPSFQDCEKDLKVFQLQQTLIHDAICRVYSVNGEEEAGGWVLRVELEWCGRDLGSLMRTEHTQGWEQEPCGLLLSQVVWALAYAQEKGVCHRDIKPSNLFLADSGLYKVADFGCAKAFNSSPLEHTMTGTPLYLSPILRRVFTKVVLGEEVGEVDHNPYKSDVYSLGLTLVSLLKPASKSILGNQSELMQVISCLPIHPSFQDVLRLMLEPEEANRPDFIALAAHIQALSAPTLIEQPSIPVSAVPTQELPSAPKRKLRIVKKEASKPPENDSKMTTMPVPSADSLCQSCFRSFALNVAESWRLDLIGSIQSDSCKQFCSLPCFQSIYGQSELCPTSLLSSSARPNPSMPMGQEPLQCSVILVNTENQLKSEQFLHCFEHTESLPERNKSWLEAPTVLDLCTACDPGLWTPEILPGTKLEIMRNSLYPDLVFFIGRNGGKASYKPISAKVVPVLSAGNCHICNSPIKPSNYLFFLHNQTAALICSPECYQIITTSSHCPTCSTSLPMDLPGFPRQNTINLQFHSAEESAGHCLLCLCSLVDYMLTCGHGFCYSCLGYIPQSYNPAFSCFGCGAVLMKSDNEIPFFS